MDTWITNMVEQLGYPGIALLMFLETVFPPLPSEVIMPLAGMRAGHGSLSLAGIVASGSAGAMVGNVLWFAAARALGAGRFQRLVERHGRWLTVEWTDVERARRAMERQGRWFVCLGRMVPTIRSLVSIPAGLLRMRWGPFLGWSTLGTVGWTALLAGAGQALGQGFGQVEHVIGSIATAVIVVLVLGYVWRVATWKRRR